ncbi:hypothetical protein ZOSMA_40G00290, partial [Zostera marina]
MSASPRIFEYFVVCGIGPEIRTIDGHRGFYNTEIKYMAEVLDQYPHTDPSLYPPPPPQLSTCVLPAGVGFYPSGFDSNDVSTYPLRYPIVLTEGDGTKIYVSCIAFRDLVCEDISGAYSIAANSFADKCICLVSRSPCFQLLRDTLEELFMLCFSPTGSSKPLWDVIAYMVSNIPVPSPGRDRVIFSIENCLLSIEVPPEDDLPHADISFQPLVQCLDVDNLIKLFTAMLLERRILFRSTKYTLLTLVSEAFCNLIYPFRWLHVYIPLLFFSGVDYIDAPTPYVIGLHSDVDITDHVMDGVVVVDLECNLITTTEDIPPLPEPELGCLRDEIMHLLHPNVVKIDHLRNNVGEISDHYVRTSNKTWGQEQDVKLRLIFLNFLASLLSGYRNFVEISSMDMPFNSHAFLKKRSRLTNQSPESMSTITQILESQMFLNYIGRFVNLSESNNLLIKLQDAIGRGQSSFTILPSLDVEPDNITISDPDSGIAGSMHCYDRFPSNIRTEEQEERRQAILAAASGTLEIPGNTIASSPSIDSKTDSLSPRERAAERERMVLDIKVKLQGLWLRLLKLGATDDPLSSFEYGTILALIENDAEDVGGSGFVECIREHIHSGWQCRLTEEQFIAVKEL